MAVTKEESRVAIVTKIEALKATFSPSPSYTLVIEYENRNLVNWATRTDPVLCVEILYIDGFQSNLAANTNHRVMGSILLKALVKKGQGVMAANKLLEHFYPAMHMSEAMFPVRTRATRLTKEPMEKDWFCEVAVIPFWYDN
jgi:hypothetical protein